MSIALSVCIKPSKILARMVLTMCVLGNAALVYIALSAKSLDQFGLAFLFICCLLSVLGSIRFLQNRNSVSLDISDTGNIILRMSGSLSGASDALPVRLHSRSTFWPMFLILHFQSDEGFHMVFPVLPDSVGLDTFRSLFVSLRWISAHASSEDIVKDDVSSGNF